VLTIIQELAKALSRKYSFDIFSPEDIESESYILACEGLEKYDGRAPLKNFLSVHLKNRLYNLRRNYRSISPERHKILGAASLDVDPQSKGMDVLSRLENEELREYLNKNMPPELRPDFLRLCDGYSLSHHRKRLIIDTIKRLMKEYGD
jgi:DNA-directed RNA polymerase specialized sigma24 family protein